MVVTALEELSRIPYDTGVDRPYERVEAVAHYAVDPNVPANADIVDLGLAPTGDDGRVHFTGDVTILRPVDGGRGTAIVEVPNRGRRTLTGLYNRSAPVIEPTPEIDPGDGFLFRHGFTVVWCGWQWDVPRSPARMGLAAPVAGVEADVQLRLQLHQPIDTVPLTDHHTGPLGNHQPVPTASIDAPDARLLVRDGLEAEPIELPRHTWRFADEHHITLDGGFEPGRIYDLLYRSPEAPVAGAGLLAVRDLGRFVRTDDTVEKVLATGQSQCGRFLRTFLHLGLNLDEARQPVYDGMLIHIAGARRGEFNHRLAQPSVQTTPSFGHLFPFADEPQTDPATGSTAGLLDRHQADGGLPRIIYTNTSSEYWRGDASLAHTSVVGGGDVEPPAATRHYLFASTQHGPGMLPLMQQSIFGSKGGNSFNIIDYTPLIRAAMMNLAAWVEHAVEPPRSAVPRLDDGTAITRGEALAALGRCRTGDHVALPTIEGLNQLRPLDLGPHADQGIGSYPARPTGDPYLGLVSALDDDGNEVAGIAMPDVTVPVATHTGFNPRHPDTGAPSQIIDYVGSTVPLPVAELLDRHGDEDGYLARVETAAEDLVLHGFLLPEDVALCRAIAAKRWRAVVGEQPAPAEGASG